jgi:hypothetical protein
MIDTNTLLQTDATVIAGILILLTIYSLKPVPPNGIGQAKKNTEPGWMRQILAIIIITAVFPFSLSAYYILLSDETNQINLLFATGLARWGFVYLIGEVIVIVALPIIAGLINESNE